MASIARDAACMHRVFVRCYERDSLQKRKEKEDDLDEISRRRLDGFAIHLVRSFIRLSILAHHRIRVFLASILAPSLSFLSHTKRTNFPSRFCRFPSSPSVFFSLLFSLLRTNISPSAASSFDRIEESSEMAAISAEIESQNGENDCECFPPPVLKGNVKERKYQRKKLKT